MIRAEYAEVHMSGSRATLMVETMTILASCYKMLVEELGEEKAAEAFAEIGKDAVDVARKKNSLVAI